MFFVLKRFAFGPIQKAIDERREQIRAVDRRGRPARDEAHKLLEEHQQLVAQARGEAEAILAEARKVADAQRDRLKEEIDAERTAARRGDAARDRGRDPALDRADPRRGRRPDARGDREGHRQGARRRGPAPPDRGGARRPRLLRARAGDGVGRHGRRRTGSMRGRCTRLPRSKGSVDAVQEELGDFVAAVATCRSSAPSCATRARPAREGGGARRDHRRRRRARPQLPAACWPRRAGSPRSTRSRASSTGSSPASRASSRRADDRAGAHRRGGARRSSTRSRRPPAAGRGDALASTPT